MEIRVCTCDDCLTVKELLDEMTGRKSDTKKFEEAYWSLLEGGRYTFFLAEEDGEAMGFLSLIMDYLLYRVDKVAMIEELIVAERYRSLGIGKALLQHATDYAKEHDCVLLELSSGFKRERAHEFYVRQGFEKCGYYFRKKLKE